jgi:cytochrome P450
MLLHLGRVPTVVVSSAAAAQEAMKTRDLAFASRPRGRMVECLLYGRDMAFAPYGEHWRQSRRVCVLHLLTQRCVLSFRRVREQETAALLDRVRGASAGRSDAAVNLSHLLVTYSSIVSLRTTFGNDSSYDELRGEGEVLRNLLADFGELIAWGTLGELVPWLWWVDSLKGVDAKVTRTFEALDGLLERAIADHRKRRRGGWQEEGDDNDDSRCSLASVLLDVKEEEETGEILYDMVTIKAIILVRNCSQYVPTKTGFKFETNLFLNLMYFIINNINIYITE